MLRSHYGGNSEERARGGAMWGGEGEAKRKKGVREEIKRSCNEREREDAMLKFSGYQRMQGHQELMMVRFLWEQRSNRSETTSIRGCFFCCAYERRPAGNSRVDVWWSKTQTPGGLSSLLCDTFSSHNHCLYTAFAARLKPWHCVLSHHLTFTECCLGVQL